MSIANDVVGRIVGFDHGAGHSLLLLYDAKTSRDENTDDFNSFDYDLSIAPASLFSIIPEYIIDVTG